MHCSRMHFLFTKSFCSHALAIPGAIPHKVTQPQPGPGRATPMPRHHTLTKADIARVRNLLRQFMNQGVYIEEYDNHHHDAIASIVPPGTTTADAIIAALKRHPSGMSLCPSCNDESACIAFAGGTHIPNANIGAHRRRGYDTPLCTQCFHDDGGCGLHDNDSLHRFLASPCPHCRQIGRKRRAHLHTTHHADPNQSPARKRARTGRCAERPRGSSHKPATPRAGPEMPQITTTTGGPNGMQPMRRAP